MARVTEFSIPAPELARLTHNALAFMPARSAVKVCRMIFDSIGLRITATDLYAVGCDCEEGILNAPLAPEVIDLSREDLQTLDKIARAKKKEEIRIRIIDQDGLSVQDDNGDWMPFLDRSAERKPADLWARVDDLLMRLHREEFAVPTFLTLDPALFARFGKVKTSGETIADLYVSSPDDPVLVKIGPTFVGAVMPVDREDAAASDQIGPEGLWPAS